MIVTKASVITSNRPWLNNFVPQYSPQDTIDTVTNKVGSNIQVIPDGKSTSAVTIRFVTNMVIAVSDGEPDVEVIRKVLSSLASTAVGLSGQGGQAIVMNGIPVLGDITNAANQLYRNSQKTPTLQFLVPLTIEQENCTYDLTCRVIGSTVTTDSDAEDEKANIKSNLRWLRNVSKEDEEKNEGTEQPNSYTLTNTLEDQKAPKGTVDVAATTQLTVRTDGAVWHDTISAVRIDVVEIIIVEECPTPKKTVTPPEKSGTTVDDKDSQTDPNKEEKPEKDENPKALTKIEGISMRTAAKMIASGVSSLLELAEVETDSVKIEGVSKTRLGQWKSMAKILMAYPQLDGNDAQLLVEGLKIQSPETVPEVIREMNIAALQKVMTTVQLPKSYNAGRLVELV